MRSLKVDLTILVELLYLVVDGDSPRPERGETGMGNNMGGSVFSGVIGGIIAVASWYVVNMVVAEPSAYVAVAIAGFCGSFFATIFAPKLSKVEA